MKKIIALLPLLASFALAGCADLNISGIVGGSTSDTTSDGGSATGRTADDNLPYKVQQIKDKILSEGVAVTFKYISDGQEEQTETFGVKEDCLWIISEDSSLLVAKKDGTSFTIYSDYNVEEYKFTNGVDYLFEEGETIDSVFNEYIEGVSGFLMAANGYEDDDDLRKTGTATVAGRNANIYEVDYSVPGYLTLHYEFAVDIETGVTLYQKAYGSAGGESGSASYEVTTLLFGEDVKIPAHE